MTVAYLLYGVAVLLALAPIAVMLASSPRATGIVYGASLLVTLTLGVIALLSLFGETISTTTLPLGLPWLGAHFRIDALAAFFLVVVNLGGASASLFALGYGRTRKIATARAAVLSGLSRRHEFGGARRRRLQLPGGVGIHVADVVGAGDRPSSGPRKHPGGLCLSADGGLRHDDPAARLRSARRPRRSICLRRHARQRMPPAGSPRWC